MISRIENKYLVNNSQIIQFYKLLKDKNFKEIFFKRKINSIYFDNKFFESYTDSEEGSVPRKKIRLRFYEEKNIYKAEKVFLEKKITSIEGKSKTVEETSNFKDYLEEGLVDYNYGICYPTLTLSYYREYFQSENIRITFDTLIEYENFDKSLNAIREKSNIMEIKCLNIENNDFIEKNFPLQKIRFSKYCSGINLLKLYPK
jgi:SPX domain protein involved in polyphosphate accumulation